MYALSSLLIRIEADRDFIERFKAVSARRGVPMTKLVRNALDTVYGAEIAEADLFFASDIPQIQNTRSTELSIESTTEIEIRGNAPKAG